MTSDAEQRNTGAGAGQAGSSQKFHRAYKACNKCRARKTRCNITAEEYAAGLPCARCRREMKECVFPTERHGTTPKQRRQVTRRASEARTDQRRLSAAAVEDEELSRSGIEQSTMDVPSPSPYLQPARVEAIQNKTTEDESSVPASVADSMMRTVVSNGKDALNLLFEVANHDREISSQGPQLSTDLSATNGPSPLQDGMQPPGLTPTSTSPAQTSLYGSRPNYCSMSTNLSAELVETWKAYRFVRMGWLSAEEAITYVDLFFYNMAPLTPIVDDFHAKHSNHYWLVVREPMLCCMILCISSRYHALPVPGGESRGYLIHQRLWEHYLHLLMRIMLGQEKASKAKTRTLGSIEALLLLCEWQPRSMHVPPVGDGWDSDVLFTAKDQRDDGNSLVDSPSRSRWLEDVINPARRFDRMSWMLLSMAVGLANELGLFDSEVPTAVSTMSEYESRIHKRKGPLAMILFTYQEIWASRLGRKSIMSPSIVHSIYSTSITGSSYGMDAPRWKSFMVAWTELTKLTKTMSDMLFPSAAITKQLLVSGRYVGIIEHFMSLLQVWKSTYLDSFSSEGYYSDVLNIEYQNARVYANSLGIQAIVERTMSEPGSAATPNLSDPSPIDYGFVSNVVDGCLEILKLATILHERNILRFAPVSIFLRITTSSVFLLKGLGLGVYGTKLRDSLGVLTRAIAALRSGKPDDLHLGSRYATLLEMHVIRLQRNFIPAVRPPQFATRPTSVDRQFAMDANDWGLVGARMSGLDMQFRDDVTGMNESWLTLPFDPSLVPFAPDNFQDFQGLSDSSLDFIWNLGT